MSWRRRFVALAAAMLAVGVGVLAQPAPPTAEANVVCDVGEGAADAVTGGVDAIVGGVAFGNPLGDACDEVSGALAGAATAPLGAALEGIGNGVFEQLTSWVSEGAAWLIGRVVEGIDKTTTPQVASKSFLSQYTTMAAIAAVVAVAILLLAVLEGLAQGNPTLLVRVALINAPLAMVATTVAYAVVQLLLIATDGLCAVISASSDHGSQRFFETAIRGLGATGAGVGKEVGGATGPMGELTGQAGGAAAAPLFVTFLMAIIGAFAAFFVWLELLMRDAAVYAVSLFLPLSLAASISPRWMGTLRRTAELLLAIIASKFVIVAVVGLAAALIAGGEGGVEHVLAASALMLLACFAPFVLFKMIVSAEGAIGAAYSRRSASGGAQGGVQMAASDVAILRGMVASRRADAGVTLWGSGGGGNGRTPGAGGGRGGKGGGHGGGPAAGGPPAGQGSGGSAAGAGAGVGGAAAGAGAAAALPAAVGRGAKSASARLSQSGTASKAQEAGSASPPASETSKQAGTSEAGNSPSAGERPPRPKSDPPPARPPRGEGSS